jgi:hypothetical protein
VLEFTTERVMVAAKVYRTANDPVPTTGHSAMAIPGSTSFTKGSELENAETSAVGRALALMGFDTHKGIASANEVQAKRQDTIPQQNGPQRPSVAPVGDGSWVCPEHGGERIGSSTRGLYCQVRGGSNVNSKGYCNFNDRDKPIEPRPKPAPVADEPPLPEPDVVSAAHKSFDDLGF